MIFGIASTKSGDNVQDNGNHDRVFRERKRKIRIPVFIGKDAPDTDLAGYPVKLKAEYRYQNTVY
jgi:hypothetical protein